MAREFDLRELEAADAEGFSDEEISTLAKVHRLAVWPVLRSAFMRYQSRALDVIRHPDTSLEQIREAQGKMNLATQLLDLLETDAPNLHAKRQKESDERSDEDDDASD